MSRGVALLRVQGNPVTLRGSVFSSDNKTSGAKRSFSPKKHKKSRQMQFRAL